MFFFNELLWGFPTRRVKFICLYGAEGKTTAAKLIQYILGQLQISSSLYSPKTNLSRFVQRQLRQNVKYIISESPLPVAKVITAQINLDQDPREIAQKIEITSTKLSFVYKGCRLVTDSPYLYLINTISTAFDVCQQIGISAQVFAETIKHFPEILGQREEINNHFQFRTFLDSAQTPLAIKAVLASFTELPHHHLIVILGHSSFRDKSQRPVIGQILLQYADKIYFTADDTVKESVFEIAKDVFGPTKDKKVILVPSRQDAFNQAVRNANKNDLLIALGRGRRNYLIQNNTRFPWSEAEAFRTAFRIKNL